MKKVIQNKDGHYEFDETPAVIQPFSIHLEKLRDELAHKELVKCQIVKTGKDMFTHMYCKGWDARDAIANDELAKLKEREARLVEALESASFQLDDDSPLTAHNIINEAIENFRKEVK